MTQPDPDKLLELAERVEAAEGPDRELDRAIAPLLGIRVVDEGPPLGRCYYDERGHGVPLPLFTSSLDAAMMLVPEGWSISMHLSEKGLYPVVKLGRSYPTNATVAQEGHPLPLTVCAAALRARSSNDQGRAK